MTPSVGDKVRVYAQERAWTAEVVWFDEDMGLVGVRPVKGGPFREGVHTVYLGHLGPA